MPFQINTNVNALLAYNALAQTTENTSKAQLQLATGLRINSVADDTSGYRVGKDLQGKIAIMQSAQNNVGSAKDVLSTAESALSSINDLLIQIQGKVTDANDPTKNLSSLANDIKALGNEISSIFTNTQFNNTSLLSGSSVPTSANFLFQTGVSETSTINFGTLSNLDLSSLTNATSSSITGMSGTITTLQGDVQDALGSIGNWTQRLNVKNDYLTSAITNATSTTSRLFNADMASAQLNATKGQIQEQIGTTQLYNINTAPQSLLALFR
ncbi:MAG TPA: flagellin [Ignavibacteriaceae bacterium]|nr:flagellin [Ignavibacteriaceae bacterium]